MKMVSYFGYFEAIQLNQIYCFKMLEVRILIELKISGLCIILERRKKWKLTFLIKGTHAGEPAFLHRIPMKPSQNLNLGFDFTRKEFPIRWGFALTIHKSQGQTIPHVY